MVHGSTCKIKNIFKGDLFRNSTLNNRITGDEGIYKKTKNAACGQALPKVCALSYTFWGGGSVTANIGWYVVSEIWLHFWELP